MGTRGSIKTCMGTRGSIKTCMGTRGSIKSCMGTRGLCTYVSLFPMSASSLSTDWKWERQVLVKQSLYTPTLPRQLSPSPVNYHHPPQSPLSHHPPLSHYHLPCHATNTLCSHTTTITLPTHTTIPTLPVTLSLLHPSLQCACKACNKMTTIHCILKPHHTLHFKTSQRSFVNYKYNEPALDTFTSHHHHDIIATPLTSSPSPINNISTLPVSTQMRVAWPSVYV